MSYDQNLGASVEGFRRNTELARDLERVTTQANLFESSLFKSDFDGGVGNASVILFQPGIDMHAI